MQYGLTTKLQSYLNLPQLPAPEKVDLAFCWDVNKLRMQKQNVFIIINTNSRFSVVAAGMRMADVRDVSTFLQQMISQGMLMYGYSGAQIARYFQLAGDAVLTKTHGRKSMGDMTIAIRDMEWFDKRFRDNQLFQPDFSDYLNQDICRPTGFVEIGYPYQYFHMDMKRLGI